MTRESAIVTAIIQYLQYMENQGKLVFIRNNTGAVKTDSGRFLRFGKAGSSDIIIFTDHRALFVEVKNEKGRQSENQKAFQHSVEDQGFQYIIVRSVSELEKILKSF